MGGYRNKLQIINISTNNPERYIDPSGHIAIELAVIVISAVVAGMAVEAGIQKFIEKKVCIDYNRIVGEGLFSGAISAISFGTGNLLKCTIGPLAVKNALSAGTGLTAKLAAALIANAAGGAASEVAEEMAHQFFVEGRTFSQIDYRQIGISAALGTVVSAGSTLAGAGIDRMKAKRAAKAAGGIVGTADDALPARMQLQYFAGEADGKTDFYVKPNGDVIPATGYRYTSRNTMTIQNAYAGKLAARSDGLYFSFDKIDDSIIAQGKLQIPYRPEHRISFDVLEIIDDVHIPNGKWGVADYFEPITVDYKCFGPGKASQAITYSEINSVKEIYKLR